MLAIRRSIKWILTLAFAAGFTGCGSSTDSSGGGASMDQMADQLDVQSAAREKEQAEAASKKKAEDEAAAQAAAAAPPEKKKAGRAAVEPGGYANAIIGARRHVLNEAESWAWKQAVGTFRAEHGRKPKDHDEFMKKIVIPLGINLGYKEENQEFFYDPNGESDGDFGQLYVVEIEPAAAAGETAK